jgi:hypothetical protein
LERGESELEKRTDVFEIRTEGGKTETIFENCWGL